MVGTSTTSSSSAASGGDASSYEMVPPASGLGSSASGLESASGPENATTNAHAKKAKRMKKGKNKGGDGRTPPSCGRHSPNASGAGTPRTPSMAMRR